MLTKWARLLPPARGSPQVSLDAVQTVQKTGAGRFFVSLGLPTATNSHSRSAGFGFCVAARSPFDPRAFRHTNKTSHKSSDRPPCKPLSDLEKAAPVICLRLRRIGPLGNKILHITSCGARARREGPAVNRGYDTLDCLFRRTLGAPSMFTWLSEAANW